MGDDYLARAAETLLALHRWAKLTDLQSGTDTAFNLPLAAQL